jgi:hypothetical protein
MGSVDLSKLASTAFDASVTATLGGVGYSASAKPLLAGASSTWLDGPVAKEVSLVSPLKDAKGNAHPHLVARFQVRAYVGGGARVDFVVENGWAYAPSPSNFTYDLSVKLAGTEVYAKSGVTHYAHARWRQTYYWGDVAEPFVKHDPAYVIASGAVPNYDQTITADVSAYANATAAPWDPMQIGMATASMPETGGRIDLGLLPGWAVAWLLSGDRRAAQTTLQTADGAGSWSIHYRDQATDRPASLDDHPYMTLLGNPGDAVNPATNKSDSFPDCTGCDTPYDADSAHQPSFVYLPYLLTGDHFYLEEMQFWSAINLFESNPAYRGQGKGLLSWDQVRGQAWSLRGLGEVAAFTPDDDPMKSYFVTRLRNNIDDYTSRYTGSGANANALGIITDGYALAYENGTGVGPWQDDFFTSAVGHVVELGFTEAKDLLAFKAIHPIGRMSAPGYCWIEAAAYQLIVRDSPSSPLYTTFAEAYAKSAPASVIGLDCASQPMADALMLALGEMPGYSHSPEGYPSNLQPALAMAAQSSASGGMAAWQLFMKRPVKPNYATEAQFAIVPR